MSLTHRFTQITRAAALASAPITAFMTTTINAPQAQAAITIEIEGDFFDVTQEGINNGIENNMPAHITINIPETNIEPSYSTSEYSGWYNVANQFNLCIGDVGACIIETDLSDDATITIFNHVSVIGEGPAVFGDEIAMSTGGGFYFTDFTYEPNPPEGYDDPTIQDSPSLQNLSLLNKPPFGNSAFGDLAQGNYNGLGFIWFHTVSVRIDNTPENAGDYNHDGYVDSSDYDLWALDYGYEGYSDADGNLDGVVDVSDYTIWRDNEGNYYGEEFSLSVPEPLSTALVASNLIIVGTTTMRRHRRNADAALDTFDYDA